MKCKVLVEVVMQIPNEYINDESAKSLIKDQIEDSLYVGLDLDDYVDEVPDVIFNYITIKSFHRLASKNPGKVTA